MKKYWILLAAASVLLPTLVQAGSSVHTKILFHSQKEIAKGWGTAGWLVLPDINSNGRVLMVAGLRYNSPKAWWVEVMPGAVASKDASGQMDKMWLVDVRFSPPPLGKHFTHWANVEWVDIPKVSGGRFYAYYQVDANLPFGLGKLGVETENTFKPGQNSISFGPHLVAAVSKNMKVSFVYQCHRRQSNQWWFRTVLDL